MTETRAACRETASRTLFNGQNRVRIFHAGSFVNPRRFGCPSPSHRWKEGAGRARRGPTVTSHRGGRTPGAESALMGSAPRHPSRASRANSHAFHDALTNPPLFATPVTDPSTAHSRPLDLTICSLAPAASGVYCILFANLGSKSGSQSGDSFSVHRLRCSVTRPPLSI
jgi:hypothetical protein